VSALSSTLLVLHSFNFFGPVVSLNVTILIKEIKIIFVTEWLDIGSFNGKTKRKRREEQRSQMIV